MSAARSVSQTRPSLSGKRATNLNLSVDALDAARQLGLNISQVCDAALREAVRCEQERRWRDEHAGFIKTYNETIAQEGLPLEQWRSF